MHLGRSSKSWKGNWEIGNERMDRDHPYCNIVEISKNTQKSSGDLRILDVNQNSEEDRQLKLMSKIHKA